MRTARSKPCARPASGEEYGLFGSRAYVTRHRDQLDSVAAVIVHDMGQDRIQGYSLGGRPELEPGLREAMSGIVVARGMRHTRAAFIGSDHFDFLLEVIPALVAIQDTNSYVLPYHSEVDTFDRVDMVQVRARAVVAAGTVYGLANAEQRIGPRLDREGVESLLRRSGMADQMKFLELWDDWESGKRGRQADP
jgi:Zn-dependent M28 family amino/carboxypeptidase